MGMTGIEPALRKELDPKSSASASFATSPNLMRDGPQHNEQDGFTQDVESGM